jgi:quercetin dioxygenase-like cupin family protein
MKLKIMHENNSKILRSEGYAWEAIEKQEYKSSGSGFQGIHRYSLLGSETQELNFHTRYFEIRAGGYSSLEMHRHPHTVVILRGHGCVILDNELHQLHLHDVVFVAPETIHQFHADQNDVLGFLCIVDRYRDKPVIPDQDIITDRITNPEVLKKIRV